jgi:hypothetical protein
MRLASRPGKIRLYNGYLAAALALAASPFPGVSARASDFHSPRTEALGGAGHAGPLLNDALYLNPSFEAFLPAFSLSANYQLYSGGFSDPSLGNTDIHGHILNVSIQDGRSDNFFQAGFGYTTRDDGRFFTFGASKAVIKRMGVGVGAKFYQPSDGSNTLIADGTLSVSGIPTDWFQVVGVVDNIAETSAELPHNLYREFILGTKFNVLGIVMIYFDPHWIPDAPTGRPVFGHELGLELTVMQDLYLRFGNFRNSMVPTQAAYGRGNALGIGWLAPRVSFDYAFSMISEPIPENAHNFGMTVYF